MIAGSEASAQEAQSENSPVIIPERLQLLATQLPVASRLGIDWQQASTADITKYVGFLASTAVLAKDMAKRNERSTPTDDDFLAALTLQCIWPPNKPPFVERYWPDQVAAFFDVNVRNALREAVGPVGWDIPAVLGKYGKEQFAAEGGFLPLNENEYFDQVFDPRHLPATK